MNRCITTTTKGRRCRREGTILAKEGTTVNGPHHWRCPYHDDRARAVEPPIQQASALYYAAGALVHDSDNSQFDPPKPKAVQAWLNKHKVTPVPREVVSRIYRAHLDASWTWANQLVPGYISPREEGAMSDYSQPVIDLLEILLKERCRTYTTQDPDFREANWQEKREAQVDAWVSATNHPWQFHLGSPWEPTFRALIKLRDQIAFDRYYHI